MHTLGQLAVQTRVLAPQDSVGKAAELLRVSTIKAVPVAQDGRLLGLLTPTEVSAFLEDPVRGATEEGTVGELDLAPFVALPEGMSPDSALDVLRANGLQHAPVLDPMSGLVGMVGEAELASAVCGRIRPPIIGGMATPFGVYLTGGGVRAGAGDLALMTTGMYLATLSLVAAWLTDALLAPEGWLARVPFIQALLTEPDGPAVAPILMYVLFALLFRVSWITGFHAAEHQVVHAIEAGDDLRPEVVERKPRVHPRCGTNIVAAVLIAELVWWGAGELRPYEGQSLGPVLLLLATFVFWRRFGGILQQYVTTRPASPRQIENGIAAGRELMARYQEGPVRSLTFGRRVWNMGLLQVLGGWAVVVGLIIILQRFLPLPFAQVLF